MASQPTYDAFKYLSNASKPAAAKPVTRAQKIAAGANGGNRSSTTGSGNNITVSGSKVSAPQAVMNLITKKAPAPTNTVGPLKSGFVPIKATAPVVATPPNKLQGNTGSSSKTGTKTSTKTDTGSSSKTGSIETNIVSTGDGGTGGGGGNQSLISQMGVQETLDLQAAQNVYDAAAAMRKFQRDQANRQLTDALGEIDRAAIENYKGIANDYAARGMSRSGGYMGAESAAMADKDRADKQANQSVTDFLDQLTLQGTADLNTLNTTKAQIMADYLARRFAASQGG